MISRVPRSTSPGPIRRGCTTTTWAGRITSPPTGRPRTSGSPPCLGADRAEGEPGVPWPGRQFLAAEAGVRQFLDIGTGLPTTGNVHDVAQEIDPACRVVYADNDPLVLAHARALLTSAPEGRTAYIHADLRDPQALLADPRYARRSTSASRSR